ncbi:MAG TPA: hypothetical protein VFR35_12020, partial [Actinoplanes sp.]|nr:hypothetical protein [Actinoplanes sp.]
RGTCATYGALRVGRARHLRVAPARFGRRRRRGQGVLARIVTGGTLLATDDGDLRRVPVS